MQDGGLAEGHTYFNVYISAVPYAEARDHLDMHEVDTTAGCLSVNITGLTKGEIMTKVIEKIDRAVNKTNCFADVLWCGDEGYYICETNEYVYTKYYPVPEDRKGFVFNKDDHTFSIYGTTLHPFSNVIWGVGEGTEFEIAGHTYKYSNSRMLTNEIDCGWEIHVAPTKQAQQVYQLR